MDPHCNATTGPAATTMRSFFRILLLSVRSPSQSTHPATHLVAYSSFLQFLRDKRKFEDKLARLPLQNHQMLFIVHQLFRGANNSCWSSLQAIINVVPTLLLGTSQKNTRRIKRAKHAQDFGTSKPCKSRPSVIKLLWPRGRVWKQMPPKTHRRM